MIWCSSDRSDGRAMRRCIAFAPVSKACACSGYVPESDLARHHRRRDRVRLPIVLRRFRFPHAQAMAAGVPVITSNISSMPEVAGDAGTAHRSAKRDGDSGSDESTAHVAGADAGHGRKRKELARRFTWKNSAVQSAEFFSRLGLETKSQLITDNTAARLEKSRIYEPSASGSLDRRSNRTLSRDKRTHTLIAILRMIPDVIELSPEFGSESFGDSNILNEIHVPVIQAGNTLGISARVAGCGSIPKSGRPICGQPDIPRIFRVDRHSNISTGSRVKDIGVYITIRIRRRDPDPLRANTMPCPADSNRDGSARQSHRSPRHSQRCKEHRTRRS